MLKLAGMPSGTAVLRGESLACPIAYRGFSLIELMVVLALAGILMLAGLPSFREWLLNSQVRTAAASINNGLQLARAEAVRRNVFVRFRLNSTTLAGLSDWDVAASGDVGATFAVAVQSAPSAEGSGTTRVGVSTASQPTPPFTVPIAPGVGLPASVVFSSFGRPNAGGITRIDVTSATLAAADTRRLVLLVSPGGQVRMCDPLLVLATNPQGCE